ncbi:GNAT family N-acetyltransferase [Rhodobacterales bacterium LSUCC0031]|nr:GNAT family N-acetyltransferase [Rhodobacterales bacterium LSUCC0031]
MTAALPDTLRSERLVLRCPTLADLEAYVAYYTRPRTGGVGGPKPRHIVVERFAAMAGQWALRGYGRYATEAARAVLDAWRGPELIAQIVPDNAASLRIAEKLGFMVDPEAAKPAHFSWDVLTLRRSRVPA